MGKGDQRSDWPGQVSAYKAVRYTVLLLFLFVYIVQIRLGTQFNRCKNLIPNMSA